MKRILRKANGENVGREIDEQVSVVNLQSSSRRGERLRKFPSTRYSGRLAFSIQTGNVMASISNVVSPCKLLRIRYSYPHSYVYTVSNAINKMECWKIYRRK